MHFESVCLQILAIIASLDELPADEEPTTEELWDALRRIEALCNGQDENIIVSRQDTDTCFEGEAEQFARFLKSRGYSVEVRDHHAYKDPAEERRRQRLWDDYCEWEAASK